MNQNNRKPSQQGDSGDAFMENNSGLFVFRFNYFFQLSRF